MALNLGNFGSRLTAEDLEKALEASRQGSANVQHAQQPASAQPQQPVVNVTVAPAQAPTAAPITAGSVSQLQGDQLNAANSEGQRILDAGERQAGWSDRQAETLQHAQERNDAEIAGARSRSAASRQRLDDYQQKVDTLYADMQKMIDEPPSNTKNMIFGLVSQLAASRGGKGAMAAQALQGIMGSNIEQQQALLGLKGKQLAQAMSIMNDARGGEQHDLNVAQKMIALEGASVEKALKQAEARAKSDAERDAAQAALFAHQTQTRSKLIEIEKEKSRLQAGAGNTRTENLLHSLSDEEFDSVRGQYGKLWTKVAKERAELEGKRLANFNTEFGTPKDRAEQSAGPREVLPGYFDTIGLEKPDVTSIRKNAEAVAGVKNDLSLLKQMRERNGDWGTWGANDRSVAEGIIGRMSAKLSQMSGAGAPSEAERQMFMKSLTDPTGFYMFKSPIKIYDQMSNDIQSSFEASLGSVGVRRQSQGRQGPAYQVGDKASTPAPVDPNEPVGMIDMKTGRRYEVKPQFVQQAMQRGLQLASAVGAQFGPDPKAAPAPPEPVTYAQGPTTEEMSDDEYQRAIAEGRL